LACKSAQQEAVVRGGEAPYCAFVDPTSTLHGPGVAAAGVKLDKLLVVRPSIDALSRTAIRVVESQAFSVVVVDLAGVPGASLDLSLGSWPRVVRRLALSAQESGASVLLVTGGDARRPLPLPVAMRIELSRSDVDRLTVRVSKERRGRVSGPRTIAWARPRAKTLGMRQKRVSA
jgi:recombination protein RecA